MEEIIKIKCPHCGAILAVKNQPNLAKKNVTCPNCKLTFPFTQFKGITSNVSNDDPETQYPDEGSQRDPHYDEDRTTQYDEKTKIGNSNKFILGQVTVVTNGRSYHLKPGRNIIGRKGVNSNANFQIDTEGKRAMSREHIVIEVKKVPAKGFIHYVSLYKEKVNKTFIGNEPLLYGDCIVLNHGDMIKLPDATLRFEIPDEDGTDI
jgi:hypothetical protein